MGRPKKKLTDNSVKVRYKTLADGRKSVYLDCCDGGRRAYHFLELYILPETDREAVRRNKATMKKVEELQRERTLQLLGIGNGGTGDKPVFHTDMPLSEWMDAYIGEQKRYGVKNTAIITKVARILGTIAPDVRMSQVDKDFCLMFIDYLRNDYRARSGQPINRTTAWGYQCKLRAALNSAVRAGVLKKNPMTQIDAADKISMPETRREYLTIDEVKRLIATPCYRERVKQAYLFCCFSGLRYGDMEKLRWRDLSCAGGQWYASIVISKTSEPLLLPLSGKAMEWLPEQEDADLLGTVTDVWLLRVTETGQPDTVTLYLTVEATASYRAGKGYWMNDTRLLCGDERSFRMAGLEARGTVISLREATELETATTADTAWDAEDSSATDTQP